jgi:hypothetical protein
MLKSRNSSLDFTVDYNVINVTYQKNKKYKILFSEINSSTLPVKTEITQIHFYYDFDLDTIKNKKYVCYDFKRIIKSYPELPEVLDEFDDYAFGYYGLKFMDTDYF